uniref:Uncharacterized protein n=1 Tax=Sus scrofa TaxID=9823 RepID=A0A4X1VKK6_PIG
MGRLHLPLIRAGARFCIQADSTITAHCKPPLPVLTIFLPRALHDLVCPFSALTSSLSTPLFHSLASNHEGIYQVNSCLGAFAHTPPSAKEALPPEALPSSLLMAFHSLPESHLKLHTPPLMHIHGTHCHLAC